MINGFYDNIWSPVTGCKHGCWYCYAKHDFWKQGLLFEPEFHQEKLIEPHNMRAQRIFVTHYTDLFGEFISEKWINEVLDVCNKEQKHEFLFITKNPSRYKQFKFSDNCILGITIESKEQISRYEEMIELKNRKMLSIEPIMGSFEGWDFSQFEFIVIGAMFNRKFRTKSDWVNSVNHSNIYYKPNARSLLK